jgi:hypothetical protein
LIHQCDARHSLIAYCLGERLNLMVSRVQGLALRGDSPVC